MSEHAHEQPEQRSRIKVSLNAKRDVQWEVSVVDGSTEAEVTALRRIAVAQHEALVQELLEGRAA